MKDKFKRPVLAILAVTAAAFVMALNNKTFINTGGLYPGGVTGLTILIQRIFNMTAGIDLPFTPVNIALNAVPVYIGFRFIGRNFTLYSCLMIVLNSIFTDIIPAHIITEDILLIAIFGGIINGLAISLCLNAGAHPVSVQDVLCVPWKCTKQHDVHIPFAQEPFLQVGHSL